MDSKKKPKARDGLIRVQCERCGRRVKFKLEWIGRKGKCPHCGAAMVASEFTVIGDDADEAPEIRHAPQKAPDEPIAEVEWESEGEAEDDRPQPAQPVPPPAAAPSRPPSPQAPTAPAVLVSSVRRTGLKSPAAKAAVPSQCPKCSTPYAPAAANPAVLQCGSCDLTIDLKDPDALRRVLAQYGQSAGESAAEGDAPGDAPKTAVTLNLGGARQLLAAGALVAFIAAMVVWILSQTAQVSATISRQEADELIRKVMIGRVVP
jgi:predicted Zn-ribbon and HTH transcriptional regulator